MSFFGYTRVTHKKKEKVYSFETQAIICSSCAYQHCNVPPEGLLCLKELGGAWSRVPTFIKTILDDAQFRSFNVLLITRVSRFLRSVAAWSEVEPIFRQRGLQIWSVEDGIGSLTDPVEFAQAVAQAEEESG